MLYPFVATTRSAKKIGNTVGPTTFALDTKDQGGKPATASMMIAMAGLTRAMTKMTTDFKITTV